MYYYSGTSNNVNNSCNYMGGYTYPMYNYQNNNSSQAAIILVLFILLVIIIGTGSLRNA